jgi:hypothetical protein
MVAYHDYTVKTLYPWDREYLSRMPPRRDDGSIFLSLATYRDENCYNTIKWAYDKAKYKDKLFVGLVQQNCHKDCKSGILVGGGTEDVPPDDDCYKLFCENEGKEVCARGQVRVLNIDEPESLGPYAARYFASKLWYGEQWFMQTDAHMTFAYHWDATSIEMLQRAPSAKRTSFYFANVGLFFACLSVKFKSVHVGNISLLHRTPFSPVKFPLATFFGSCSVYSQLSSHIIRLATLLT